MQSPDIRSGPYTHLYFKPFSTVFYKKCAKLYPGEEKNANIFYLCKILGRGGFFRRAILYLKDVVR